MRSNKVTKCDTTNTNTGAKGGVVVYLKKEFIARRLEVPQYIFVPSIMC